MNYEKNLDYAYSSLDKYTSAKCGSGITAPYFVTGKLNEKANAIAYFTLCNSGDCILRFNSSNVNTHPEMRECQKSVRYKPMSEL